jgi:hypothetical protein
VKESLTFSTPKTTVPGASQKAPANGPVQAAQELSRLLAFVEGHDQQIATDPRRILFADDLESKVSHRPFSPELSKPCFRGATVLDSVSAPVVHSHLSPGSGGGI